jgi:hypothetical protein
LCLSRNFPLLWALLNLLREGLGRSKPATNPWNEHNNTTVGISTISKPYWTVRELGYLFLTSPVCI